MFLLQFVQLLIVKEKFKREFKQLDGVLVENTVEKVIKYFS